MNMKKKGKTTMVLGLALLLMTLGVLSCNTAFLGELDKLKKENEDLKGQKATLEADLSAAKGDKAELEARIFVWRCEQRVNSLETLKMYLDLSSQKDDSTYRLYKRKVVNKEQYFKNQEIIYMGGASI
jgi:hypothetical protein